MATRRRILRLWLLESRTPLPIPGIVLQAIPWHLFWYLLPFIEPLRFSFIANLNFDELFTTRKIFTNPITAEEFCRLMKLLNKLKIHN